MPNWLRERYGSERYFVGAGTVAVCRDSMLVYLADARGAQEMIERFGFNDLGRVPIGRA
jgi:hypothetical protein